MPMGHDKRIDAVPAQKTLKIGKKNPKFWKRVRAIRILTQETFGISKKFQHIFIGRILFLQI